MNRDQVLEQLEPLRDVQYRRFGRGDAIITPAGETFGVRQRRGRTVELAPEGVKSMLSYLGLPVKFATEVQPRNLAMVATDMMAHREVGLLTRGGQGVEMVKGTDFRSLAPERVLGAIERGLPGAQYHRATLHGQGVTLEVVGVEEKPVVRGDLVRAGALVSFSPIGSINPTVQAYVLRLSCTNGATAQDVVRNFGFGGGSGGGGEGDDVWQWFRRSVDEAAKAIGPIVTRWQELRDERISPQDRAALLEALLKEAHISGPMAQAVRELALEHPPQNHYDLLNLMTSAASHTLTEPTQRLALMGATSRYAARGSTHEQVCPACRRRRV